MTQSPFDIVYLRRAVIPTSLVLLALCPFLVWSFFIFPVADDLSPVNWTTSLSGLCDTLLQFRRSLGGAYSAVAFRWLHAPLTLHGLYWLTPSLFMLMHLLGGSLAFRVGFESIDTWPKAVGLSAVWLTAYLGTMYSPAQSVFWATGMLAYEPGNVMALILAALVTRSARSTGWDWLWLLLVIPVAFGCHFPFALWGLCLLGYRAFRPDRRRQDVLLVTYALIFFLVVFLAPGNFNRHSMATESAPPGILAIVFKSGLSFAAFLVREMSFVQNWLWLGLAFLLAWESQDGETHGSIGAMTLVASIGAWLLPLFGIFLLSVASKIDPPFPRTQNALHYLFICGGAFIVVPSIVSVSRGKLEPWLGFFRVPLCVRHLATALLLFSIASPNWVQCVRDLLGSAREYKQYWTAMNEAAAAARAAGKTRLEVPAEPPVRPPTVFTRSWLKADPDDWPNANYAKFFGLREFVGVQQEEVEKPKKTKR